MIPVTELAWHNGRVVPLEAAAPSIASISLHMGTGVFDGLMAYWNNDHFYLHKGREHLQRLRSGAERMLMPFPWTDHELEAGIRQILERAPKQTHYIRPIVFRGAPQLLLTGSENRPVDVCVFGVPVARDIAGELACQLSPVERVSSRAMPVTWKVCGLYVNSYLARRTAEAAGFQDGVMLDREGRIAEASAANIFFLEGDRLVTPRLTPDIFPGITRMTLLDLAAQLGVSTVERDLFPPDLPTFDGAFICATLMEIRPLSRLGATDYSTESNELFRALLEAFRRTTRQ
jgi:branched-chain amino acid aminotransferase